MNTHLPRPVFRPLPLPQRIASLVLIGALMVLGLIGLLLPVLPGLLFLFLAALLSTRISHRAALFMHRQTWFHTHLRSWQAGGHLSLSQRARLGLLISLRVLLRSASALFKFGLHYGRRSLGR